MNVMMAAIKILLLVTTAANQALMVLRPCAVTAACVFLNSTVVVTELNVTMALMNLTYIPSAIIAQKRDIIPAQVFPGTVESSVMAFQLVQIDGTSYFQFANLTLAQTNQMGLLFPSAVRRPASTSVKMDPCA